MARARSRSSVLHTRSAVGAVRQVQMAGIRLSPFLLPRLGNLALLRAPRLAMG
jgi:hypothetical protein